MTFVSATSILYVDDFGAVGDGSTNDAPAVNAALAYMVAQRGGELRFTPGKTYLFTSQVTLTMSAPATTYNCHLKLVGYGATIKSSGAISALRVTGNVYPFFAVLEGLYIDHDGNSSAPAGIELRNAKCCQLRDCVVVAGNGTQSGYAAYDIGNSDPHDNDTGSISVTLQRCSVRQLTGTAADYCVRSRGANNALRIFDCVFGAHVSCVLLTYYAGLSPLEHYIANGVLISGNTFEDFDKAISVAGESGQYGALGLVITNNRFETGNYILELTGATVNPGCIPAMSFNQNIFGIPALSNPAGLLVNIFEFYYGAGVVTPTLFSSDGFVLANGSGSAHCLTLQVAGGNRGLLLTDGSGTFATAVVREPVTGISGGIATAGSFAVGGLPTSAPGTTGAWYVGSGTVKVV